MNAYKIAAALGNIGGDLVRDAGDCAKKTNKKRLKKLMTPLIAAILAAVAAVSGILIANRRTPAVPRYDKAMFSAEDVASAASGGLTDSAVTNAYQTVYAPSAEMLDPFPIPDSEYLKIYELSNPDNQPDEGEFEKFSNDFYKKISAAIGISVPEYKIKERHDYYNGRSMLETETIDDIPYEIWCVQSTTVQTAVVDVNSLKTNGMSLSGTPLTVDRSDSDEQIAKKILPLRDELFNLFGVKFSDVKVERICRIDMALINIYFYNASKTVFDGEEPLENYINLTFYDHYTTGSGMIEDTLTHVSIRYSAKRSDTESNIKEIMELKKISLSEAEALLEKGYVFGGHTCDLCMEQQKTIDFSGYDQVGFEYLSEPVNFQDLDRVRKLFPFYTFYKAIGTSENGNIIYAKTYVPAIEVNGLEEYFDKQAQNHYIYY